MIKKFSTDSFYFIILAGISSISFGLFLWELSLAPNYKDYFLYNAVVSEDQTQILICILASFLVITGLSFGLAAFYKTAQVIAAIKTLLKLLSLLFLFPLVMDKALFKTYPSLLILTVTMLSFCIFFIFQKAPFSSQDACPPLRSKISARLLLALMVAGYSIYFSYCTVINHYNFGTSTYDLTFFQNALINTLHGHFMKVSFGVLSGSSLFRDHCDFIMLIYLPFFYLIQKTETLLTVQSVSIALAAVPLFFFSRRILKSSFISLLIALLYLFYPANHCANFYDIHELSFLPLATLLLFYSLETKSVFGFIGSVAFMLSLKLDMFLLLIPIAAFIYFNDPRDWKFSCYTLAGSVVYGIIYLLFIKKWLIKAYAGYFSGVLPADAPMSVAALLKAAVSNPVFLFKTALTKDKILFLFQIFGPLAFVPLMRSKNIILLVYGLAFTLLGNNSSGIHTIYFQYVWYLVPFLFIGTVYVLRDMQNIEDHNKIWGAILQRNVFPVLITLLFASFIYTWQYGAVLNRQFFTGGFHQINFNFTPEKKKQLEALDLLISRIPPNAQVSAPEPLTAHLVNHGNLKRFSDQNAQTDYLLLRDPETDRPNGLEFVNGLPKGYEVIDRKEGFQLLVKSSIISS